MEFSKGNGIRIMWTFSRKLISLILFIFFAGSLFLSVGCSWFMGSRAHQKSIEQDQQNYALGILIGRDVAQRSLEFNESEFLRGVHDGIKGVGGSDLRYDEKTMHEALVNSYRSSVVKHNAEVQTKIQKNREWFETNGAKADIKKIQNNIQVHVARAGKGLPLGMADTIDVAYRLRSTDGKLVEDESKKFKTYRAEEMPTCWARALSQIPSGGSLVLYCGPEVAYGGIQKAELEPFSIAVFEMDTRPVKKREVVRMKK
jgi:FKBP-type peptidyl-prolyl cis-trans isomerase FklB